MSWADEVRILGSKSPFPYMASDRHRLAATPRTDRSPSVKLIRDISLSQKKSQAAPSTPVRNATNGSAGQPAPQGTSKNKSSHARKNSQTAELSL